MESYGFIEARDRLKSVADRVVADRMPVRLMRRSAEDVVMVSARAWVSIEETLTLLGSPANARLLLESIAELDALWAGDAVGGDTGPLVFSTPAAADVRTWQARDPAMAGRIVDLIEAILREPHGGMGQPQALRGPLSGWWSRRIGCEPCLMYGRLVYRVTAGDAGRVVEVARCGDRC